MFAWVRHATYQQENPERVVIDLLEEEGDVIGTAELQTLERIV